MNFCCFLYGDRCQFGTTRYYLIRSSKSSIFSKERVYVGNQLLIVSTSSLFGPSTTPVLFDQVFKLKLV